jgi:hypothetical protein
MKIKALLLVLFVAGLAASIAIAKPPPGKGKNKGEAAAATTTAVGAVTTASLPASGKVTLCHKTGQATKWVRISVSVKAATKRIAKGDVWLQDPAGTCVGAAAKQKDGDDENETPAATTATTQIVTTAAATTTVTP